MRKINYILLFFSIAALLAVYIAQYVFNIAPCKLCLYERIPYWLIILFTVFGINIAKFYNITIKLCKYIIIAGIVLAAYHVGVEQNIFPEPKSCSAATMQNINNIEELTIYFTTNKPVSCSVKAYSLFNISFAGWNLILLILLLIILIKGVQKNEKLY